MLAPSSAPSTHIQDGWREELQVRMKSCSSGELCEMGGYFAKDVRCSGLSLIPGWQSEQRDTLSTSKETRHGFSTVTFHRNTALHHYLDGL